MNTDKSSSSGPPGLILSGLAYLLIPSLLGGLFFGQLFPFFLKGPQFLGFYLVHMLSGWISLMILNRKPLAMRRLSQLFMAITLLLSLSRIIQGCYHHKPVGYLLLLTVINVVLLWLATLQKPKTSN